MADPSLERLVRERDVYATDVGEVDRILALPVAGSVTDAVVEDVSRTVLSAKSWEEGFRLWRTQAASLLAYDLLDGVFAKVGVGWGKGGIAMLIAEHAYRHKGIDKAVLLIPSSMAEETVKTVYPMWQWGANLTIPLIPLAAQSRVTRESWARSGKAGLYVLSYPLLSRVGGLELLSAITPGLIIADEAHYLKDPAAGLTKKFLYYMKHAARMPRFAAMSGTFTDKRLLEFHHLISLALGARSPLPLSRAIVEQWSELIDSTAVAVGDNTFVEPLVPLLAWGQAFVPEAGPYDKSLRGLRNAFASRLVSAPGVISTGDEEIKVSLEIGTWPCGSDYEEAPEFKTLKALMADVEKDLTPDGDTIPFAIQKYKWLRELSGGFYMSLQWPSPEVLAERYGWPSEKAEAALDLARRHHATEQAMAKLLRDFLANQHHPIATPMEVFQLVATHPERVPKEIRDFYSAIKNAEAHSKQTYGRLVERDSKFVRVCPFKVDAAVEWAREHKTGLLWCWHRGMAVWCLEALAKAGMDPADCKRGEHELINSLGDPRRGGRGDRLAVLSVASHYQGKNLQAFSRNLVVEWPRRAKVAQQLMGRTHRNGQVADVVRVDVLRELEFDHVQFAATLNDAAYIQFGMRDRQKILTAGHTTVPRIYSPEFLAAQGAEPQALTEAMRKELARRFGQV